MGEWIERPLGELTCVLRRGTAPVYVESSAVSAIGQRCVRNEGFDRVATRPHDSRVEAVVRPEIGDVLINSTGTGTIGRSCMFREGDGDFMVDGHVTLVRPVASKADGRFLNELVRSPGGQRFLESHCFTGSTNQVELSRTQLSEMPVVVPPLEEQQRIAEILDAIDETIRATERTIAKLQVVLRGLQQTLLDRGNEELRIADLISGQWPGEWGTDEFSEGSEEALVLRATNFDGYAIDYSTAARRYVTNRKAQEKRLKSGDLLLEAAGGGPGVPVGRVAHFDQPPDGMAYLTSNFFRTVRPLSEVDSRYLYWLLDHEYRKPNIWACQQQTTGIINLKLADYLSRRVRYDRESQAQAASVLDTSLGRIRAEENAARKLRETRAGLADDLLSGRVRTVAA